jgi:predicted ester cyclase
MTVQKRLSPGAYRAIVSLQPPHVPPTAVNVEPTKARQAWDEASRRATMSAENKGLVRRWIDEVFNRPGYDACEAMAAKAYIDHALAPFGQIEPGQVRGPQHLRETAEWLFAQFPDMHMTIQALVAEDDMVAVRILSEGTNLGTLNGVVPPTGKRFAAGQSHWLRSGTGN